MVYEYEAQVVRVVDGDTVVFDIDLGFSVRTLQHIRLNGVDTPEIRSKKNEAEYKAGKLAEAYTESWLTATENRVILVTGKSRSFSRFVGTVTATVGPNRGRTLGEMLLESGHAEVFKK